MKIDRKSSRGPSGGALAPPGVPKGSQKGFWERTTGSLDPPGPPDGAQFSCFVLIQSVFLLIFGSMFE